MEDKSKEKLRKLRALIYDEATYDGERDNAKRMYDRLLKKHGLTDADIEPEPIEIYWFAYRTPFEKKLLGQLSAYASDGACISIYTNRGRHQQRGFELTEAQYEKMSALWDGLRNPMAKELDRCYGAFIQTNKLGVGKTDASKLTPEEIEEIEKLLAMMRVMDKTKIRETNKRRLLSND